MQLLGWLWCSWRQLGPGQLPSSKSCLREQQPACQSTSEYQQAERVNILNDRAFIVDIYPLTLVYTEQEHEHLQRLQSANLDKCTLKERAL